MFNAKINIALIMLAASACTSRPSDSDRAADLLGQATEALGRGEPELCTSLLDSLERSYPGATDIRHEAHRLRPRAIEAATLAEISLCDSLLAVAKGADDELSQKLRLVSGEGVLEPYYTDPSTLTAKAFGATSLQPRADRSGGFTIVATVAGCRTATSIRAEIPGHGSFTSAQAPVGSDLNYAASDGSQLITLTQADSDSVGALVAASPRAKVALTFLNRDGKSAGRATLDPRQCAALANTWLFSQNIRRAQQLAVRRQMLEQRLAIARDQAARL